MPGLDKHYVQYVLENRLFLELAEEQQNTNSLSWNTWHFCISKV